MQGIKIGMTKVEVSDVLGPPTDEHVMSHTKVDLNGNVIASESWIYSEVPEPGQALTTVFEDDEVVMVAIQKRS